MGTPRQDTDEMDEYKLQRRRALAVELAYLDKDLYRKGLVSRPAIITKEQWSLLVQTLGQDVLDEIFKRH